MFVYNLSIAPLSSFWLAEGALQVVSDFDQNSLTQFIAATLSTVGLGASQVAI